MQQNSSSYPIKAPRREMEPLSLKESKKRWQVLLNRQRKAIPPPPKKKDSDDEDDDPFDCQSLMIPPTHVIVDQVLDDFEQQWAQLDFRKIEQEKDEESATAAEGEEPKAKRPKKSSWHAPHLKIPDAFDYATQGAAPSGDADTGARVMSLIDPTQTSCYEKALWEIFQQVPTLAEVEEQVREGVQLPHSSRLHKEIEEGNQNYSRLDGHALSRIRRNDRHQMIPSNSDDGTQTTPLKISTIRLECFRRQPKRGSSPDPDRAIFEFLGSQTLADVHRAIVELADDEIWKLQSPPPNDSSKTSGFFFIENQFYSTGPVDYVTPIQKWLEAGKTPEGQCARKIILGIEFSSSDTLAPKPMAETRLRDLSWSLGMRYHHVHHGDVECAIFVTDFNHSDSTRSTSWFPLIHDIWTPTAINVDCEGCQKFSVARVTPTTCSIALGNRSLCQRCCQTLLQGTICNSS